MAILVVKRWIRMTPSGSETLAFRRVSSPGEILVQNSTSSPCSGCERKELPEISYTITSRQMAATSGDATNICNKIKIWCPLTFQTYQTITEPSTSTDSSMRSGATLQATMIVLKCTFSFSSSNLIPLQ